MPIDELKGQIARLPQQPGVYLFLDANDETLYVGKARVLRDRVRSYLSADGSSPRIDALLRDASAIDAIVTDSVVEALALENRLIKHRNPRYNVLLRDDKTYPYLRLTTTEAAPRILVARRVERDGDAYAGPFMPASVARRTMTLAHRLFGIRSCNEIIDGRRDRPCLEYDIKRCLAPCVESVCSLDRYRQAVEQTRLLLDGRQEELVSELRSEMAEAAGAEQFERAAQLRDAVATIAALGEHRNKVETVALGDRDAFGLAAGPAGVVVTVFPMRSGKVIDRLQFFSDSAHAATDGRAVPEPTAADASSGHADLPEVLEAAVRECYADRKPPPEIHLPLRLAEDDRQAAEDWLSQRANRRVKVAVPQRGPKRGLLDLASRNAAMAYQSHFGQDVGGARAALEALRVGLNLPVLPRRIECFDISTLHGRDTVGSMVVCVDGRMRRSDYRRFRIRGGTAAAARGAEPILDDVASMHEVVLRRYRRALESGGPFPDVIVIDGGKGQLTAAYDALRDIGLDKLVAVGLAKAEELLFTRDRVEGLALPRDSAALRLLQRVRDEAHRFAISYHRRSRTRRDLRSVLDDIAGIGPRRRKQLLTAFGSVAGVRRASKDELAAVVGPKAADAVLRHFADRS